MIIMFTKKRIRDAGESISSCPKSSVFRMKYVDLIDVLKCDQKKDYFLVYGNIVTKNSFSL